MPAHEETRSATIKQLIHYIEESENAGKTKEAEDFYNSYYEFLVKTYVKL